MHSVYCFVNGQKQSLVLSDGVWTSLMWC